MIYDEMEKVENREVEEVVNDQRVASCELMMRMRSTIDPWI
jgi:hypothetical protein